MNDKGSVKDVFAELNKRMKGHRILFFSAFALLTISTVMMVLIPSLISEIVDIIKSMIQPQTSVDSGRAVFLISAIIVLILVNSGASYCGKYLIAVLSHNIASDMRMDVSRKIDRLSMRYLDKTSSGDIISRVTNDTDKIAEYLQQGLGTLMSSSIVIIGCVVMMFVIEWRLAIACITVITVGIILVRTIASKSQKHFNDQMESLGELSGHVEEVYSGRSITQMYIGVDEATERFTDINGKIRASSFKAQAISAFLGPAMMVASNLGYVVICISGAIFYMNGEITFGVIPAFILYVDIFSNNMSQISNSVVFFQNVMASTRRISNFLAIEDEGDTDTGFDEIGRVEGHVEFRNVMFSYEPGKPVLHNFSLDVKPNQKIAIVGPTGSGKSTILNILLRFYEIDSGEILIDGKPVSEMDPRTVRRMFTIVPQEPWVFEGTLRDNLVLNNGPVSDEELLDICKRASMDDILGLSPKGLDMKLSERRGLSAGQKQMITIARSMVKNSPMVIMDEATSSIDSITEMKIKGAFDALTENRTTFVVAHRLSTIEDADKIVMLDHGRIVDIGTHKELLEREGPYYELYHSQFVKRGGKCILNTK